MSANLRRHDLKMNGPKLTRLIPIAAIVASGAAPGGARAFNGNEERNREVHEDVRARPDKALHGK